MRKFEYPAIYKHFKDKLYATMAISKAMDNKEIVRTSLKTNSKTECFMVKHTEQKDPIYLYKIDNEWYHRKDEETQDLALYKSLYDDTGIYARPLSIFLSEVDTVKYPDSSQQYRFELVTRK